MKPDRYNHAAGMLRLGDKTILSVEASVFQKAQAKPTPNAIKIKTHMIKVQSRLFLKHFLQR
jgi:hypothetical protein